MSKKALRTGLFLALTFGASSAVADPFGQKGEFAFSGERLFGIYHTNVSEDGDNADSVTQFSFMGQAPTLNVGVPAVPIAGIPPFSLQALNPYATPKLAFDYFVIDGLTLGGSLIYAGATHTTTRQVGNAGTLSTDVTVSAFVFAPRVGYAYMFSDSAGIWPRGGFTYYYESAELPGGDKASLDGFALNLDVPFVLSPVEHFAFLVGPGLDLGLAGGTKLDPSAPGVPTATGDANMFGIGLYAGLMGWI